MAILKQNMSETWINHSGYRKAYWDPEHTVWSEEVKVSFYKYPFFFILHLSFFWTWMCSVNLLYDLLPHCFRNLFLWTRQLQTEETRHFIVHLLSLSLMWISEITGAIFICHVGIQKFDVTFSCWGVLQSGCQIMELNLFVLGVIQAHSAERKVTTQMFCALFCFQCMK